MVMLHPKGLGCWWGGSLIIWVRRGSLTDGGGIFLGSSSTNYYKHICCYIVMAATLLVACRAVVLQQLEESGCEAVLKTLSLLCTDLESAKSQRGRGLAALQLKRDRIDQFAKMTVRWRAGLTIEPSTSSHTQGKRLLPVISLLLSFKESTKYFPLQTAKMQLS